MKKWKDLLQAVAVMLVVFGLVFTMTGCGSSGGSSSGNSDQNTPGSSDTDSPGEDNEGSDADAPDASDPSTWIDGDTIKVPGEVQEITAEIVDQMENTIPKVDMSECLNLTIEGNAFKDVLSLQEVYVPANVTIQDGSGSNLGRSTVVEGTFSGCYNLDKVVFVGTGTTNIGKNAFYNCQNLDTVILADTTNVGESAFQYCTSLKTIQGTENISSIGEYAFYNCSSLAEMDLNGLQNDLPQFAFGVCSELTSVVLPDRSMNILEDAFYNCPKLKDINLEKVASIGERAFRQCASLQIADLQSIVHLGLGAFKQSGLTYIRFSNSVKSVASDALATAADKVYVYYGTGVETEAQLIERLNQVENWEYCGLFYNDNDVEHTKIDGVLSFNQWESDMAVIKDLMKANQSLAGWFTF